MTVHAFGNWDALSRERGVGKDMDEARGYYARGEHSGADLAQAIRKQWCDDAPAPADVRQGHLRHVPYRASEVHPCLGRLTYRGTVLRPSGPGRGAFAATYWIGNDPS